MARMCVWTARSAWRRANMPETIVILGAGQGGLQAAISLRQNGYDGRLTLIGAEPGLPYQRPPLSKAYLKDGDAAKLTLRPQKFLDDQHIAYRPDTRVHAIDRSAARLALDGAQLAYDHLILATGTRPARLPIPGFERCLSLRSLADAVALRAALPDAQRIAVIGGGFIGLEFAAVARAMGKSVTVLEASDRLMSRAISAPLSARFLDKHRELGTDIKLSCPVQEVTEDGVLLADGTVQQADLVLSAAGVVPNAEIAHEAGLPTGNGVLVDHRLLSADPNISAIGDVACFPDANNGNAPTRLESVQAATDHARHVARRICTNDDAAYRALAWFWSDQADWKLQIAGLYRPGLHVRQAQNGAYFLFDADQLVAVETINDPKTHMLSRRLLSGPGADEAALAEAAITF